jgi:hypothetical protein
MRVRIAYITDDDVNDALAREMAQECGATLIRTLPGGVPLNNRNTCILYDLDHMPFTQMNAIWESLISQAPHVPVAIHSYNLDEEQMESLRANGVISGRALDKDLVHRLCRSASTGREPFPVEDHEENLEVWDESTALPKRS